MELVIEKLDQGILRAIFCTKKVLFLDSTVIYENNIIIKITRLRKIVIFNRKSTISKNYKTGILRESWGRDCPPHTPTKKKIGEGEGVNRSGFSLESRSKNHFLKQRKIICFGPGNGCASPVLKIFLPRGRVFLTLPLPGPKK